jgi:formylglycine-generating enzyme required for sulfatase activity
MPSPSSETRENRYDGATLVWVPPGDCLLGSSEADIAAILRQHPDWRADWFVQETPRRATTLPGYWIYRDPVTVAQFRACCAATGWEMPPEPPWGWLDDHPMVNASWQDATHYAAWAGAAVPSEAQWEKAARGVDGRTWPWGDVWDADACAHAGNAEGTHVAGSHPANVSPFGVRETVGNVWEWCQAAPPGEYAPAPSRPLQRHPPTPSGHVLRGGSWQSAFPAYLRCAYRCFECDTQRGIHVYRRPTTGFRCVVV